MSIEIRQMTIKSTLVSEAEETNQWGPEAVDLESLKQSVIEECRELIEKSLDELQER